MYTADALAYAVHIAKDVREAGYVLAPSEHGKPS